MACDAGVVQTPRQRPAFDDELDLEAGQQDFVEHPDDQLVLADGETPHRVNNRQSYRSGIGWSCLVERVRFRWGFRDFSLMSFISFSSFCVVC